MTLSNVQLLKTPAAVVSMKSEREVTALLQVPASVVLVSVWMHVLGLQLWFQKKQLFTVAPVPSPPFIWRRKPAPLVLNDMDETVKESLMVVPAPRAVANPEFSKRV